MSTEYTIEIGAISGHGFDGTSDEAWRELVLVVEDLRYQPQLIADEAVRFGIPATCERECCTPLSVADAYRLTEAQMGPLVINHTAQTIVQLTTGDRAFKVHIRRAFCRLVIAAMHRKSIEVNLIVS